MEEVKKRKFIGVVCGLKSEALSIVYALTRADIDDMYIRIEISGASADRAEALSRKLVENGAAALVSVGLSGALTADTQTGELFVADSVISPDGETLMVPEQIREEFREVKAEDVVKRGAAIGVDDIVSTIEDKAALAQKTGAITVDMESHRVAKVASEAGIPFAVVRAIADGADRAIPTAALDSITEEGETKSLSVLFKALKSPGQLPTLIGLGADAALAQKVLRGNLGGFFLRLLLILNLR